MSMPHSFDFTCPREMYFDDNGQLVRYRATRKATRNSMASYVVSIPGNKHHTDGAVVAYSEEAVRGFIADGGWVVVSCPPPMSLGTLAAVCGIMAAYLAAIAWVMLP